MPDVDLMPRYLLREHRGSPTTPYLNQDVLRYILQYFGTLDRNTLSSIALVCHNWLTLAQGALYRQVYVYIEYDFDDVARVSCDARLNRTLIESPHLLSLVRLFYAGPKPRREDIVLEPCQWIDALPEHILQEFVLCGSHWGDVRPYLLEHPAYRSIRRVFIQVSPIFDWLSIRGILALPELEELFLTLRDSMHDELGTVAPSKLRHLSVRLTAGYNTESPFDILIAAVGSQLRSLSFSGRIDGQDCTEQLSAALNASCRRLRRLKMYAYTLDPAPMPPVVDRALLSLHPTLEYLHCYEDTYSDAMFKSLPSTLKVLELHHHQAFPYAAAVVDLLGRVPAICPSLTHFTIHTDERDPPYAGSVAEACRAAGVCFTIARNIEFSLSPFVPLHTRVDHS